MRRSAISLVAAAALITVSVPCLLRLAQWRFDIHLRDTAARSLALAAHGDSPWHWRFADARDIVAGRVFDAGSFDFAADALTVRSDGRAFEIGLPLPLTADLRRFPQMDIAATVDAPGHLAIVAAQELDQPAMHGPPIDLSPGRSIGPIALTAFPDTAAMLRLRVELPRGAQLHLHGVTLERAAGALKPDLDAPARIDATIDEQTTNGELAALAENFDVRTLPNLRLMPGANPNRRRSLLARVRAQLPAAILIPADEVGSTFARARALARTPARAVLPDRIAWLALVAYIAALLAARRYAPRRSERRAPLEAVLVSAAPIWLIAGDHFSGRLDAL
ncbi:MAG: hypothetical protein JSS28_09930, partial [Proteobacteria bacterium]|nr:hypothetical protein [Pseudomonadota bacterium]